MNVAAVYVTDREPDPTGTAGIRISFRAAARLRLRQLRSQLRIAVMENDLLGLGGVASGAASFQPTEARLRSLNGWLEAVAPQMLGGHWLEHWVAKAWYSGERVAAQQVASAPTGNGSGTLLTLAQAELDGIIAVLVQQVTREAARALVNSQLKRPRVWLRLARVFDKVAEPRLCALANTITVMAHNHGRGAVYREAGFDRVGIIPEHEWPLRNDAMFVRDKRRELTAEEELEKPSRARLQRELEETEVGVITAGDDKVCQECEDYANSSPHEIDEALDTLPMHVGCRCAIYPWYDKRYKGDDALTGDFNKEHEPAGSSIGGQFASAGVEGTESEFERWGGAAHGETVSPAQADKVKELAAKTPGLKNLLPYLAPDEINRLKKATVGKMVEVFTKYPVEAEEMAAVAYSGRAKQGWYRKSAKALVDVFGATDAPRFAALMAALSPQTGVEDNAINALNTWTNWLKAGRPTDRDAIVTVLGRSVQGEKGAESILPAWINNSVVALSTPADREIVLSGPKVDSFAENLRGHVNAVTNDSWMANYLGIKQAMFARRTPVPGKYSGKGPMYIATAAVTRKAAEILTEKTGSKWTPAEIQETIWSWAKTLYEHASADKTTIEQLLKAGSVTHEDIADTPDFAVLFTQNVYRKILEGGGYAEQAAALGAGAGAPGGATASGSLLAAEGSGIAPDAFTGFLFRAAARLDQVRTERAQRKAEKSEEDGLEDFDPSEPRDPDGKWTGSGGSAAAEIVVRPRGWEAGSDDVAKMTREGHVYRGMSEAEYNATVGAGKGIKSNLSASIPSAEGTNFSEKAEDAESYANYGRLDPRKTGKPNYLVEVKKADNIQLKPDGYLHAREEVPPSQIARVWKMEEKDGAVVATLWTGGDDSGESKSTQTDARHPGEGYSAAARVNTDGVIQTTEASDVATAIFEKRAVSYYAHQISDLATADFTWDPDKHPRGQPENKGQFGPGGGGAEKPVERERTEPIPEHMKATPANVEAAKGEIEKRFKEATTEGMQHGMKTAVAQDFVKARDTSERPAFLSSHTAEELQGSTLLMNAEGNVGISVDQQGDIQNVFNNGGPKGSAAKAMVAAIDHGGRTLDCYDGFLRNYYTQFGFDEVQRMKFDPAQAPPNWDIEKHNQPDIVFMAWGGYIKGGAMAAVERAASRADWVKTERTQTYGDDWNAAKEASRSAALGGRAKADPGPGKAGGEKAESAGDKPVAGAGQGNRGAVATEDVPDYQPGIKARGDIGKHKADWIEHSPIKDVDTAVKLAPQVQKDLGDRGRAIAEEFGVEFVDPGPKTKSLKGVDRVREKAKARGGKVGAVTDIARCAFIIEHPEQSDAIAARLSEKFEVLAEAWRTTPVGYTDRALLARHKSGMIAEIQILDKTMAAAKQQGHALYEQARALPPQDPKVAELNAAMRAIYGRALEGYSPEWKAALGKGGKSGKEAS